MKLTKISGFAFASVLLGSLAAGTLAAPLGTAFTYQGRLDDGGRPANGSYDLQFTLHDAANGGGGVGGALTNAATTVSNGLFTVWLDFGNVFDGAARWLEIAVRTNGGGSFTPLSPRQALTPAPYALFAPGAGSAATLTGPVPATQITGSVPLERLPSAVLTNNYTSTITANAFAGDGSRLTGVVALSTNAGFTNIIVARAPTGVAASDTPNLQYALTLAGTTPNKTVLIPSGVYRLNNALAVPLGVNIRGQGCERQDTATPNGTFLLQTANTNILQYQIIAQQWLADIGLRGPSNGVMGGIVISNGVGDFSPPGEQFSARNVSVKDMGFAVITASPSVTTFEHCYFFGCVAGIGLHLGYADSIAYRDCNLGYGTNGSHNPNTHGGSVPIFRTTAAHQLKNLVVENCEIGNANPVLSCNGGASAVFRNCNFERLAWQTAAPTNAFVLLNGINLVIDGGRVEEAAYTPALIRGVGTGLRRVRVQSGSFNLAAHVAPVEGNMNGPLLFDDDQDAAQLTTDLAGGVWRTRNGSAFTYRNAANMFISYRSAHASTLTPGIKTRGQVLLSLTDDASHAIGEDRIMYDGYRSNSTPQRWTVAVTSNETFYGVTSFPQGVAAGSIGVDGTNVFVIRAGGGVGINTNNPQAALHVAGNILATGTITPNSDRNAKTGFVAVDTAAVLEKVVHLPIQQWRFQAEAEGVKHVGPMAQDFRAAFGLGEVPTAIATVDADGVALAAIQGLNQKLENQLRARDAEIQELKQAIAEVKAARSPTVAR